MGDFTHLTVVHQVFAVVFVELLQLLQFSFTPLFTGIKWVQFYIFLERSRQINEITDLQGAKTVYSHVNNGGEQVHLKHGGLFEREYGIRKV